MVRGSTRRRFLVTVGAGTVPLAGCFTQQRDDGQDVSGTVTFDGTTDPRETDRNAVEKRAIEASDPPENGAVVFVYDDGPMTDYTQAFPAHQSYDAPATVGIVSEWVGRKNFMDRDWMGVTHLTDLVDAGWEIASHTAEHTTVGTYELVEDAAPNDERVYPTGVRHGFWTPKDVELTDGDKTVRANAVGRGTDDTGRYVELADPVGDSFAAGEAVIRYPADVMKDALLGSKQRLEALGFDVETFLAPYDDFDAWSQRFVDDYYIGVANGDHGSRINDPDEFSPYRTRRAYFIEFTEPKFVQRDLDAIAERGALGVFGAHTHKDSVTEDRIRTTLEWIEQRDIEVVTLRDAIDIYVGDGD
ncbi:polysaccharide deacetylase family protein [Halocatena salina]|uniref:Polysaccharide deacetylase family protein n=1 Tax=Halocatena salina TaxID=2934340 RepID=A0A8U0A5X5_9EURY|nr:polysaccharide deacetylase family protein [Halocatena salina]UPM44434.1 polysaccharide deacetylase family protein [Halocatena salina]